MNIHMINSQKAMVRNKKYAPFNLSPTKPNIAAIMAGTIPAMGNASQKGQ